MYVEVSAQVCHNPKEGCFIDIKTSREREEKKKPYFGGSS